LNIFFISEKKQENSSKRRHKTENLFTIAQFVVSREIKRQFVEFLKMFF